LTPGSSPASPCRPPHGKKICKLSPEPRRKLVKRGVPRGQAAKAVHSHEGRWALSNTRAVNQAFPAGWFTGVMGQYVCSDRKLAHWFEVSQWIRLT